MPSAYSRNTNALIAPTHHRAEAHTAQSNFEPTIENGQMDPTPLPWWWFGRPSRRRSEFEAASMMRSFDIRPDDLTGPEVIGLLQEHLDAVSQISPPESVHALDLDGLRAPDVTFWSVWQGSTLAGCGALKELDAHHAELKSMRTASSHLRTGVAAALLEHILHVAKTVAIVASASRPAPKKRLPPHGPSTPGSALNRADPLRITSTTRTVCS